MPESLEADHKEEITMREISGENSITTFLHCGKCLKEWKDKVSGIMSPQEYSSLDVGYSKIGLQIWCKRHNHNVIHLDFEGHKHPANVSTRGGGGPPDETALRRGKLPGS